MNFEKQASLFIEEMSEHYRIYTILTHNVLSISSEEYYYWEIFKHALMKFPHCAVSLDFSSKDYPEITICELLPSTTIKGLLPTTIVLTTSLPKRIK